MKRQKVKVVGDPNRYWRTLIRCHGIDDDSYSFVVPGWGSNRVVLVKKAILPPEIAAKMENGLRLYVEATIGVDDVKDLKFRNWEMPTETAAEQTASIRSSPYYTA